MSRPDIAACSPFVVTGGVIACLDDPGYAGSSDVWRAVYRRLLSRPRQWRVISDRDAGSIIALERLDDDGRRLPWSERLLLWRRNAHTAPREGLRRS